MQALLEILGRVVLSSAMASLLICVILLVKMILNRRSGPAWHYYIWFLLIFRLVVPFSLESSMSIFNLVEPAVAQLVPARIPALQISGGMGVGAKDSEAPVETAQNFIASSKPGDINAFGGQGTDFAYFGSYRYGKPAILVIWMMGAFATAFYVIMTNRKLSRKIRKEVQALDELTGEVLEDCKARMDIGGHIPVIYSGAVCSPALYGVINPRILLPHALKGKISREELKFMLLHELAHLKRCDNAVNWITVLIKAVHWFNPLIWYAFYKMRQDCEVACDALVLSCLEPEERKEYGYAIINLLKLISASRWIPGAAGMLPGKSQMERRITMISLFRREPVQWIFIGVLLFMVVGLVGLTDARHEKEIDGLRRTMEEWAVLQQDLKEKENKYKELDSKYNELQQQAARNEILSGMADVEGKGVVVTISDNVYSYCDDKNLRDVVNELVSAGAEAVSINEERFVSTSEIRRAGSVIMINTRRYGAPFVIKAIGNPDLMEISLKMRGGVAQKLEAYQLEVKIEKAEKLSVPRLKGEKQFKYAQPVETEIKAQ